jgi:hypothetical protein
MNMPSVSNDEREGGNLEKSMTLLEQETDGSPMKATKHNNLNETKVSGFSQ